MPRYQYLQLGTCAGVLDREKELFCGIGDAPEDLRMAHGLAEAMELGTVPAQGFNWWPLWKEVRAQKILKQLRGN